MNILIKFFVLFAILFSFSKAEHLNLDVAVQDFSSMPEWTKLDINNFKVESKNITKILYKYSTITPDEAQILVSKILSMGGEFDMKNAANVYLFNRIYFNVPSFTERNKWEFFGGWSGVPVTESKVNSVYPFTVTDDGTLELTGVFGGYFGPAYRGLEEFKFFLKNFGQRELLKKK